MLNKIKTMIEVAVLSGTVSANVQAATVTVQKGDTLWDLSRENNTSVENIQTWNHLTTDLIHPGDKLTIAQETHYTVKQDDTLSGIAAAHSVSVSQIKEWNQLITDLIHPGLNLVLFEGVKNTDKTVKPAAPAASPKPAAKAEATAAPAAPKAKPATESKPQVKAVSTSQPSVKEITVKATAYTASCEGCSGITKTGVNIKDNPDEKVIAVDPKVIPLGSKVYVEGFGEATAADTGGAIKGNRIDIFIPSEEDAIDFGVKHLKVKILN